MEKRYYRYNKKFRFQLLASWITEHFEPCRVLDVGGGKGMLAYFLNKAGFSATVVDPHYQELPKKYKDIQLDKRILISPDESVPRISKEFSPEMVEDFDLVIGLHTHGSNMLILEAATKYKKNFILLPCCVIDEPIEVQHNVNWFESLDIYARHLGHDTKRATLDFKGQAVLMWAKKV